MIEGRTYVCLSECVCVRERVVHGQNRLEHHIGDQKGTCVLCVCVCARVCTRACVYGCSCVVCLCSCVRAPVRSMRLGCACLLMSGDVHASEGKCDLVVIIRSKPFVQKW